MRKRVRCICVTILCTVLFSSLSARSPVDSNYVFHFVPGNDMFYVPWKGNGPMLDTLVAAVKKHTEQLRAGQMYVCVSSYAASSGGGISAKQMAHTRCSRVKSELILRAGLTEEMFVTDRRTQAPYGAGRLRNVVVVSFPAPEEKVMAIAGPEAAARVRAYNRSAGGNVAEEGPAIAEAEQQLPARHEEVRPDSPVVRDTSALVDAAKPATVETVPPVPVTEAAGEAPYRFALRTNLLRWATLTPDIGAEWRVNRRWGIVLDVSYTYWSWDEGARRYSVLNFSPGVRRYLGRRDRFYAGGMLQAGNFNYKFGTTGRQGDYLGVGITGGWQMPVAHRLMLAFEGALGYTHARYDKYRRSGGYNTRAGSGHRNYFGINRLAVSLAWTFGDINNR